jgi:hypothetical protein
MGSHYLEESQLSDTWKLGVTAMFDLTRLTRHFPVSSYLAHAFPVLTSWVVPPFRFVYELEQVSQPFSCYIPGNSGSLQFL